MNPPLNPRDVGRGLVLSASAMNLRMVVHSTRAAVVVVSRPQSEQAPAPARPPGLDRSVRVRRTAGPMTVLAVSQPRSEDAPASAPAGPLKVARTVGPRFQPRDERGRFIRYTAMAETAALAGLLPPGRF